MKWLAISYVDQVQGQRVVGGTEREAAPQTYRPHHSPGHPMSLTYSPRVGSVVVCDFNGLQEPEMIKRREVVVMSNVRHDRRLVTVIPLSSTAPHRTEAYHHRLTRNPRPGDDATKEIWAKCDMLYTLCTERMNLHYTRTRRGGRQYVPVKLSSEDFESVRRCVAAGLGLAYTEPVPSKESESGSAGDGR